MNIYAHRGLCTSFPDNSRGAILAAIQEGFDIEIDLRVTKDKKFVLLHDTSFEKLCNNATPVSMLTSHEIKTFSFVEKKEEGPIFLEELLSEPDFQNSLTGVALHFKQEDQSKENCNNLIELFKKWNLFERAFLFNLSIETAQYIRAFNKYIVLSCIVSDQKFEPYIYLWDEINGHSLDMFDIIWAAEYRKLYDDAFFEDVKSANKKIVVVSHELHRGLGHPKVFDGYNEIWTKFLKWKVDGVCTDYPEELYRNIY